jgi:hypothetical protein
MGMLYRGTQGCMYCNGVCCTKECIEDTNQKTKMNKQHPLKNTLTNLKEFKNDLDNFSALPNEHGWSLSNLPTYFWETLGQCINDIDEFIKEDKKQNENE